MAKDDATDTSVKELLEAIRLLVSQNALSKEAIASLSSIATRETQIPYHAKSAFNPLGDLEHPRSEVVGEVYWLGHMLQRAELTQEEIEWVNRLVPGRQALQSLGGRQFDFEVRNLESPGSNQRRLLVVFPCEDADQRMDMPPMVTMIQQYLAARGVTQAA